MNSILKQIEEKLNFKKFNEHWTYLCHPTDGCIRVDVDRNNSEAVYMYNACLWSSGVTKKEATLFMAYTFEQFLQLYVKFQLDNGDIKNEELVFLKEKNSFLEGEIILEELNKIMNDE